MLTYVGSVCYIVSLNGIVDAEDIMKMSTHSPLQRLTIAVDKFSDLSESLRDAIQQYEWFLQFTNVSEEELKSNFRDMALRTYAFSRANLFGDQIFEITRYIAEKNNYLRFLLV